MADYLELKEQKDRPTNNGVGDEVIIKQPRKTETEPHIDQEDGESNENKLSPRRRTMSDAYERRQKERKEKERRRIKQLEEDDIRRRGRRKKQRMQRAKNIGQKSVYDALSKREKDLNRLNELERKEFEREMDKVLADGDLDDITDMITAHKLTKCKTNSLEKSLEVSHKLKTLADTNYPDAEDFRALAAKVEDFSIKLLEPLKGDDMKRAIFEGEDFDRIAEKAILFRQKKFISHPVVYNLLMKRWTGVFYHMRHRPWTDLRFYQWVILRIWAAFDVIFFPIVFTFLYIINVMAGLTKKECHAVVVISPCNLDTMEDMQDLVSACFALVRPKHTTHIFNEDNIKLKTNDPGQPSSQSFFMDCLKIARKKFGDLEKAIQKPTDKLLIVLTDDRVDESFHALTREAQRIRDDGVRIISVGFGVHPDIKELETMATNQQNVFLYHGNVKLGDIVQKMLESLRGKSLLDRYLQYFNTPYFIYERDTLSYLALLGLHVAMCIQPSTLHFTAVEWVIMLFFMGRLLMEIYQAAMEKHLSNKLRKPSRDYENWLRGTERLSREKIDGDSSEIIKPNRYRRGRICRMFFNIMSRYFSDWWNAIDLLTLVVYIVIIILRSVAWAEHLTVSSNRVLAIAGYLYGLNTMFLTLRVFGQIMESQKNTGSIQIALFQIIGAVIAIFGQFLVTILAFSLAITKVYVAEMSYTKPNNTSLHGFCEVEKDGIDCWWGSARHLVWSLLGEPDIDPLQSTDVPSDVLAHLLYGIFLLLAVVMLMNMMIALLSNTYQAVEDNAFYEWSYRRATTIRTYVNYHPIPVPFNIISCAMIVIGRFYKYVLCCQCCVDDDNYLRKRQQTGDPASFFDCLVFDLQAEYFSQHGYAFPLAESSKMDWVFRETEGNRQLIGHIATQVFPWQASEDFPDNTIKFSQGWNTRGINIRGHIMTYVPCDCVQCGSLSAEGKTRNHGAISYQPCSRQWPGFEVLIQESLERRLIVIGMVPGDWPSPHVLAGCQGNSAGYHVDEGKIFDLGNQKIGIEGAMAQRGDLIGCQLSYDSLSRDGTIPVLFTINGRVIGEGRVKGGQDFYPFVGIGWEGISLLFKMSSTSSQQLLGTNKQPDEIRKLLTGIYEKVENLQFHYENRQASMLEVIHNLERKIDNLSESFTCSKKKEIADETPAKDTEEPKETLSLEIVSAL